MSKTEIMEARIREGWYDAKLKVLMANAETTKNIGVMTACIDRIEELTVGFAVRMPSKKSLDIKLPKGITAAVCHPGLRIAVPNLARCVRTCRPWSIDIGFTPTSIIATKYMGLPAIKTRIGNRRHNVSCTAVLEELEITYLIETNYPDGSADCEVFETFEPALELFDREVEDECLL